MKQSRNTFKPTLTLAVCFACLFSAGSARSQMVYTQVNAADRNSAATSRAEATSGATEVNAQANYGQEPSRTEAAAPSGEFSAVQSRKMFDGDVAAFSTANSGEFVSGFGSREMSNVSSRSSMTTESMAAHSTVHFRIQSARGYGGMGYVGAGQFPDTTREIFWPSPSLYQSSSIFSFNPGPPIWSPTFGETSRLRPSFLVTGPRLSQYNLLSGHTRGQRFSLGLPKNERLTAPLTRLNSEINSGLKFNRPITSLTNPIQDPLADGN